MQWLWIILGVCVLVISFLDFFHTTFSGNGFGIISGAINRNLTRIILRDRSKTTFKYSGLIHVIINSIAWLVLLLIGVYLILISDNMMVVHENSSIPATYIERFYYMCYVISTLGNGDFMPGNDLSRIFTGIFSFLGLILLTTALTYFVSVVKAVLQKKQLALYLSSMGEDIHELYNFLDPDKENGLLQENTRQLKKMIIEASSNYIFFPIIQYYLTDKKRDSAELQLARLNEVLFVLRENTDKDSLNYKRIDSILQAIYYYLELGIEDESDYKHEPDEISKYRTYWEERFHLKKPNPAHDAAMNAAIKGSGWTWKEVYEMK